MKMPLLLGLALLAGLLLLADWLGPSVERSAVLATSIAVALWTAFSLKIPPRARPLPEEEEDLLRPPEDGAGDAAEKQPGEPDGPPKN